MDSINRHSSFLSALPEGYVYLTLGKKVVTETLPSAAAAADATQPSAAYIKIKQIKFLDTTTHTNLNKKSSKPLKKAE